MSEDGFHEIQLNGKQLVFLFMAATVAAVVIFLCGVLVGRGVPAPSTASAAEVAEQPIVDPTAAGQPAPNAADIGQPASAGEDLSYPTFLDGPTPASEVVQPPSDSAAVAPVQKGRATGAPPSSPSAAQVSASRGASAPAQSGAPAARATPAARTAPAASQPPPAPPALASAPADTTMAEPPGTGFVVQVAAVRQRAEALVIARRLGSKGYPAFVTTAGANVFRVRVGKYPDRGAAEAVATRLEREEQFKPWITR